MFIWILALKLKIPLVLYMRRIISVLLIFSFLLKPLGLQSQAFEKIIEFLTIHPNAKAVKLDSTLYPSKAIFTPVVSYAPETNLSLGLGMKGLFKMKGSGSETRTSNMPLTVQYTIENKYLFFSGFQIFWPKERYILAGNLRVQSFPSLFFGLGPDTPKTNEEEFGYSQILFEPIFTKKLLLPHLFLGGGIRYNKISSVESQPDGLLENTVQLGALGSTSAGFQFAMIYDNRDNLLNAKKGVYLQLTHGFYGKILGGTQKFELTRFDFRYYLQPNKTSKNVLAFQLQAQFSHNDVPLLELGRLGGDVTMRGYFEGRYTDRHLIATQVEWRQKLSRLLGLTAFTGIGGVAPSLGEFSFDNVRPAVGVGVRFLIDPKEDLNLRLDFGRGQEKLSYYFKIAEAF